MPGFDEAVPKLLLLAIQEDPSYPPPYRHLAAFSRLDAARDTVARLRNITSVVIPDTSFLRNPEHRELYLSGLRLAIWARVEIRVCPSRPNIRLDAPNPALQN
ncbi:MAG: hypothetical protein E6G79_24405 [Alphaproteobacteria bacterium]|nr:MAG: hypothetical protein E6G79_24405 [Alphaproteobacteria bacterium]